MSQYTVLVGSLADGYDAYGPFISFAAADKWAQSQAANRDWVTIEIFDPSLGVVEEKGQ